MKKEGDRASPSFHIAIIEAVRESDFFDLALKVGKAPLLLENVLQQIGPEDVVAADTRLHYENTE